MRIEFEVIKKKTAFKIRNSSAIIYNSVKIIYSNFGGKNRRFRRNVQKYNITRIVTRFANDIYIIVG